MRLKINFVEKLIRNVKRFVVPVSVTTVLGLIFAVGVFATHPVGGNAVFHAGNVLLGRNITQGQTEYVDPVSARGGERVRLNVLMWNQGPDPAEHTRVKFNLANAVSPSATFGADNSNEVADIVNFNPGGASLRYVTGSAKLVGPRCQTPCSLSDEVVTNGVEIGQILPGSSNSYQVVVDVDLEGNPQPGPRPIFRTGNIFDGGNRSRPGTAEWEDPISARSGEIIEFRVQVINDGTADAQNTSVRVELPSAPSQTLQPRAYVAASQAETVNDIATVNVEANPELLVYLPGHTRMFGPGCTQGCALPDSITTTGVTVGTVRPGAVNSYQVLFKAGLSNTVPTPTPTPTPTPIPTATPTPGGGSTPSPTPQVLGTTAPKILPKAGAEGDLALLALGLIPTGVLLYKRFKLL